MKVFSVGKIKKNFIVDMHYQQNKVSWSETIDPLFLVYFPFQINFPYPLHCMCRLLKVLSAFNKGFTLCHIIQLAILCLIELPLFKITDLMNVTRLLILQTKTKEMFIKTNISAILQRKKNMYNSFFDLPIVNKFSFFSKA